MKKLLVAIDMTAGSRRALGRAARFAAARGASLRILHAVPSRAFDKGGPDVRRFIQDAVRLAIDELPAPRPAFSLRITSRDPRQAILEEARKVGADMIVLGAHGEPRLRDAIFGTTATHVVRHSERPVLVVQTDDAIPYAKVMLALDGPEQVKPLLDITGKLAPGAKLIGVHAFDPPLGRIFAGREALEREADRREAEIGKAMAEATADAKDVPINSQAIVDGGGPLTVLMDEAKALRPDLVVMGTSQRAYLNSYAVDAVFWCEQDLLVVPEREGAESGPSSFSGAVFA